MMPRDFCILIKISHAICADSFSTCEFIQTFTFHLSGFNAAASGYEEWIKERAE